MTTFLRIPALALASIIVLSSCGGSAGGGSPTLPPTKASPEIFAAYRPDGNSTMADGWALSMDMSGVSFNDTRTATLITPRHVVMAKHYARDAAEKMIFHDRSGKRIERKLIGFSAASGDVMVGLLDEAVPSNYRPYALPTTDSDVTRLVDLPVIVTDQNRRLFIHLVARIGTGQIAFKQDERDLYGWGKNLVVGDSGNPSFVISGNQLVLVETHTTGGSGAGPYYGDPTVQSTIRAAVEKLDSSYTIRTVRIP